MYVLYVSLENLLYSEIKFLSLKNIHCQKSYEAKKSKFYPKRLIAFKIQTVEILKVDMKPKFLFSDMIVQAKLERRLLTVS